MNPRKELEQAVRRAEEVQAERAKILAAISKTETAIEQAQAELDTARSEQAQSQAAIALSADPGPVKPSGAVTKARDLAQTLEDRLAGLKLNLAEVERRFRSAILDLDHRQSAVAQQEFEEATKEWDAAIAQVERAAARILGRGHALQRRGSRFHIRLNGARLPDMRGGWRPAFNVSTVVAEPEAELAKLIRRAVTLERILGELPAESLREQVA